MKTIYLATFGKQRRLRRVGKARAENPQRLEGRGLTQMWKVQADNVIHARIRVEKRLKDDKPIEGVELIYGNAKPVRNGKPSSTEEEKERVLEAARNYKRRG